MKLGRKGGKIQQKIIIIVPNGPICSWILHRSFILYYYVVRTSSSVRWKKFLCSLSGGQFNSLITKSTHKLLQMHYWEHPVGLYHRLVRQLHRPQPQSSPEGLHNASPAANCLPSRTPITPDVTGRPKDHQGQQPPETLPVHPAITQKARSVQVHQSWDRETEKQLLGHQT